MASLRLPIGDPRSPECHGTDPPVPDVKEISIAGPSFPNISCIWFLNILDLRISNELNPFVHLGCQFLGSWNWFS
uniref:Uncharacterized protein n=1 Tax=Noccaea caerulescens TaxID=107243 RepID=A0A1J3J4B8_NOCCA